MRKSIIDVVKYIWQLPQNIIALIYLWYLTTHNMIPAIKTYKDREVYAKYSSGSIALGKYIFLSPTATESTLKHEYGHTMQSLILGPLYLIIIGIPSLLWAMYYNIIDPNISYYWFFTESSANKLGNIE